MIHNWIFIILATGVLGILVVTSNMTTREKQKTVCLMIALSICLAVFFNVVAYFWLVPTLLVGCLVGHWANKSMDRRRFKYIQQVMRENKTSL